MAKIHFVKKTSKHGDICDWRRFAAPLVVAVAPIFARLRKLLEKQVRLQCFSVLRGCALRRNFVVVAPRRCVRSPFV
jgi:hypothetical protein